MVNGLRAVAVSASWTQVVQRVGKCVQVGVVGGKLSIGWGSRQAMQSLVSAGKMGSDLEESWALGWREWREWWFDDAGREVLGVREEVEATVGGREGAWWLGTRGFEPGPADLDEEIDILELVVECEDLGWWDRCPRFG